MGIVDHGFKDLNLKPYSDARPKEADTRGKASTRGVTLGLLWSCSANVEEMQSQQEEEVSSETLRVESKVFYLDLKRNQRGEYLKIAEKGTNRERSTIIIPAAGIPWFRELFNYYAGGTNEAGQLVGKEFPIEAKVFFFELGENPRGRFLRISESGAGPRGRSSIIIPAGGANCVAWAAFRDTLLRMEGASGQVLIETPELAAVRSTFFSNFPAPGPAAAQAQGPLMVSVAGQQTVVGPGPAPPSLSDTDTGGRIVRAGHKRYFFDLGSNQKGAFLRITEVVGTDRISIIVPADALPQFQRAITQCLEQHQGQTPRGEGPGPSMPPV